VFYNTTSTLTLSNYTSANAQDVNITKTNVTTGAWHHFAIVRSGTTLSLYVDGVLAGSDTAFTFDFNNTSPVKWGGSNGTSVLDRWLNGSLADLAVFNAALSGADITKLNTTPVQWLGGQNASASIAITVLAPIDNWRQTQFGTTTNTGIYADTADKDKDGLLNLLEYACATNPNTNNASPWSAIKTGSNIEYIYTQNKAATDVTYSVEWSDTLLSDWSTAGVTQSLVPGSDNGVTQQWKAVVPAGSTRRFVHLRVTRP
jgi:hypothetical protein